MDKRDFDIKCEAALEKIGYLTGICLRLSEREPAEDIEDSNTAMGALYDILFKMQYYLRNADERKLFDVIAQLDIIQEFLKKYKGGESL